MKDRLSNIWSSIKDKWSALAKNLRIFIVTALSVAIVVAIVLTVLLNQSGYVTILTGLSSEESTEVMTAISELGVTDVKLSGSGDVAVPSEQADSVIMQLSIQGYPKSTFNNNVWDTGVGMFSTDSDKRVKEIQQLQSYLMAVIQTIDEVQNAYVILSIPETKNYVITNDTEVPRASVKLSLKSGKSLNEEQIEGIYSLILNAVTGLERDNITVTDSDGSMLSATGSSAAEDKLYQSRLAFQKQMQDILKSELDETLKKLYSDYTININILLDYDKSVSEITTYTPTVVEDGTSGGMIQNQQFSEGWGGVGSLEGVVGTTGNSDISPNYPTITGDDENQYYYQNATTINRLVNTEKKQLEKSGYDIEKITASITVDETNMLEADRENLQKIIAYSIGADVTNVAVSAQPFLLTNNRGDSTTIVQAQNRDWLYLLIVSLGLLVIALLVVAILTSSSKKKKRAKAKAAATAAAAAGEIPQAIEGYIPVEAQEETTDFSVQSLMDENINDTKGSVLKREIRDFSKNNPEIVAQLLRTLMRDE